MFLLQDRKWLGDSEGSLPASAKSVQAEDEGESGEFFQGTSLLFTPSENCFKFSGEILRHLKDV